MSNDDDWRLDNGEDLRGATFVLVTWRPPPPEWVEVQRHEDGRLSMVSLRREPGSPGWTPDERPIWDHDHCKLCWQRLIDDPGVEDGEPDGWRTGEDPGSYQWVCKRCFGDFENRLAWKRAA
jgi:hypothetical protein